MNKSAKFLKFLIGWPLSVIALFFLWRLFTPQIGHIEQNILHINYFLLFLGLCAFQLYFLFRIFLWKKILQIKGHEIPLRATAWYWSLAEINRYIPGNVWSIVGRGATFGKFGMSQATLLLAWGQESVLILFGSGLVGLFALGYVFYHFLPHFFIKGVLYWVVVGNILALCVLWIIQVLFRKSAWISKKISSSLVSPTDAFHQLLLSGIAFIFFGLGTYLSITSLFLLPIQDVTLLIGLFSLSFTIGYLSFIVPMGLGVRELIISRGLLPYLSNSVVGFAALYARFFLIVAEIIFLLLAFIFFKIQRTSARILYIKRHLYAYLLGLSIAAYIGYFTTASFYRYINFFTGRFDLGNMDQTVWNTIHGKIFMLTDPNGTNVMLRLGTHADFILVLISPLYLLWQDPRMLLLLQTVVLACGALFVYFLTIHLVKNKPLAYVLSLTYLLNPSIQNSNLYDFHAVTLATTFFLGAWYCIVKKRYVWMIVFLFLAGATKEEAWIVVACVGLYLAIFQSKKILGGMLALFSTSFFYLLVWKFIPFARGGQHFALSYYSDFGGTPTNIIKNIFLSPVKIASLFFAPSKLLYYFELLLPVGFVALLMPQYLLFALPDIGINILSSNTQLQQIYYQYTAVITPFLFIATIYALRIVLKKYHFIPLQFFSYFLLGSALVATYFYGPLPGALRPNIDMFVKQQADRTIIENFLQDIPSTFSVAATNNVGSHLSHRQKIFTIPVGIDNADVVIFLLNDQFAQPSLVIQKQIAENMKHDKNYIEVFKKNDFIVFEKRNLYTKKEPTLQKGKLYPAAIQTLENRDFEGGRITIQKPLQTTPSVTTMLFSYPSDGLTIYARADVPSTSHFQQPFPVVIINRGFLSSSGFNETTSYKNISQAFATHGFLAIMPDYRNNGESDTDRSIVGILGYPIDVLNLLNSLPNFPQADTQHVFLWGYSVGGQITLSTLAAVDQNKDIIPTIQAASVWAPVIDQYRAYTQFHQLFPSQTVPYARTNAAFGPYIKNQILWESISPLFYLDDITTPVRIVHGLSDTISPYQWSIELYTNLKAFHNTAQIVLYPNADHNFTATWRKVVADDIAFFQTFLQK